MQPLREGSEMEKCVKCEDFYEKQIKQWDYWRKEIANGNKSSAPRDWFESILYELNCEQIHD